jgi:phosphoribosylformylglycinamidine synthase subunit PurS
VNRYTLQILVTPRPGLLDPQGKAIQHALEGLEFPGVRDVRVGKAIRMELDAPSADAALETAEAMGRRLLANPVTEDFQVELLPGGHPVGAGTAEGRP